MMRACRNFVGSRSIGQSGRDGREPCIRGMRVTVGMIVGAIAAGRTIPELPTDFPYLEEPDIREALAYAASLVQWREIPLGGGCDSHTRLVRQTPCPTTAATVEEALCGTELDELR